MSRHSLKSKSSTMLLHLAALLVVVVWGSSFVSTRKIIEGGLNPVEIYLYRFIIAYLLIWPFCHKRLFAKTLIDEILLLLCGLCGGSIYFIAENYAVGHSAPSNVSLLTTLAPLLTTLLFGMVYKNERPGKWVYIGSAIAMVGAALIIFKNGFSFEVAPLGDLLAISAAFSWAVYCLVLRKVQANYTALFITRKTFFYGLVGALPFLLLEPNMANPSVLLNPSVGGNLIYLALCGSLLGYYVWSLAMKKLGTIKASNYLYFQPVATMVISAIVFTNDPITFMGCVGCVLIIAGVWLGDSLSKRRKNSNPNSR